MVMMLRKLQYSLVSPFSRLQKPCHASYCGCAGACLFCNRAVRLTQGNPLCNLETFTPRLKLSERTNITKEFRNFGFVLACCNSRAESPEPGVLSPVAFGEALLSHMRWIEKGVLARRSDGEIKK